MDVARVAHPFRCSGPWVSVDADAGRSLLCLLGKRTADARHPTFLAS